MAQPSRRISKAAQIEEARKDPVKAGQFLEEHEVFRGPKGYLLLSVFADCIVAAHEAKLGKANATGAVKWSVTLGWHQSRSSGLIALNFGNDYLCNHTHRQEDSLKVCLDAPTLLPTKSVDPNYYWEGFHHLPDSVLTFVDSAGAVSQWPRLKPAFIANCDKASQVWSKLHARSYPAHAPGLLEYLRVRLKRSDIPNPEWKWPV